MLQSAVVDIHLELFVLVLPRDYESKHGFSLSRTQTPWHMSDERITGRRYLYIVICVRQQWTKDRYWWRYSSPRQMDIVIRNGSDQHEERTRDVIRLIQSQESGVYIRVQPQSESVEVRSRRKKDPYQDESGGGMGDFRCPHHPLTMDREQE